jgi:hypothetical protein
LKIEEYIIDLLFVFVSLVTTHAKIGIDYEKSHIYIFKLILKTKEEKT